MFRQIRIHQEDATWQRILSRESPEQILREYQLLTVTYGTASMPYLAIRVLQQLAEDEHSRFPSGAEILRSNTYVDAILPGGDSLSAATRACNQLIKILATSGMRLDKWSSIYPGLNQDVAPSTPTEQRTVIYQDEVATLGIQWSPQADAFTFKIQSPSTSHIGTKRLILSDIATLYEPLGWLSPLIVRLGYSRFTRHPVGLARLSISPIQISRHSKYLDGLERQKRQGGSFMASLTHQKRRTQLQCTLSYVIQRIKSPLH